MPLLLFHLMHARRLYTSHPCTLCTTAFRGCPSSASVIYRRHFHLVLARSIREPCGWAGRRANQRGRSECADQGSGASRFPRLCMHPSCIAPPHLLLHVYLHNSPYNHAHRHAGGPGPPLTCSSGSPRSHRTPRPRWKRHPRQPLDDP